MTAARRNAHGAWPTLTGAPRRRLSIFKTGWLIPGGLGSIRKTRSLTRRSLLPAVRTRLVRGWLGWGLVWHHNERTGKHGAKRQPRSRARRGVSGNL